MKKTVLVFLMILAALSAFAQNGVLRELSGTVELKTSSSSAFVAANVGDQVAQDTVISTGFKSNALVEIGSTLIAVRPLTRLTLTEIRSSAGSETLNVNLAAGRVQVDVNPPAGTRASMSVTSPSATASVRGTSLLVDLLNCKTLEGKVDYRQLQGMYSYLVGAGFQGSIGSDGNLIDPLAGYFGGLKPKMPAGSGEASGGGEEKGGDSPPGGSAPDGSVNVGLVY